MSSRVYPRTAGPGSRLERARMCCDLHTHSTASDGSDTPYELVRKAAGAGLVAVAVTDHDSVAGLSEAFHAGIGLGVEVLPGVEVSVRVPRGHMHLLGFLFDPASPVLKQVLEKVQAARAARNPVILARLNALGLPVSSEELDLLARGGQIGRPHIARAMVHRGYVRSVGEAFARYLRKGAPAYVPKSILTPEEGIAALHGAGGLAVLAHPVSLEFRSPSELDEMVAAWARAGLDGIECYYSEHPPEVTELCLSLCDKYGLVPTGGSDYHGEAKAQIRIGRGRGGLCVPYSCVAALRERCAARAGGARMS